MRLTSALVLWSAVTAFTSPHLAAARVQGAGETLEPFRAIGNVHYVGGE